eukprot:PDM65384.1 hypothetical protein PRIPAC_52326 [Pristionchus pacificus]
MVLSPFALIVPSLLTILYLTALKWSGRDIREEMMMAASRSTVQQNNMVAMGAADNYSFPKIELHLHLDGSIRFETLLDLSRQKRIPLRNATTVPELKKLLITDTPKNLSAVLAAFEIFLPVVTDDLVAIERIAYELCEDQAKQAVVYFEARYSPHLLLTPNSTHKAREVVEAVTRGLRRGKDDFGVDSRQILCMICGLPQYNWDLLNLVETCKDLGVVGIDVAGSASGADEKYEESVVQVFQAAHKKGLHRTAHAGEAGGAKEVLNALNEMYAERIGHGYRILRDEEAYRVNFLEGRRAHLEACPYSSVMTGAVVPEWNNHPIKRWAEDGADFSISRDDPTCFDNTPKSEMGLAHTKIGLTIHQLWQAQLNAAKASFAEEPLKSEIIAKVELHLHLYGAIRFETLLDLSRKRGLPMGNATTVAELKDLLVTDTPKNLAAVLRAFEIFLPVVKDDFEAIERVAYELCEDQAKEGVIYFEGRYSPHRLLNDDSPHTAREVVEAVTRGLRRGKADFGVDSRQILGADEKYEDSVVEVFQAAYKKGLHRTAHAGEAGGAREVVNALNEMHAERIGHGYPCPYSSVMTGAVPPEWTEHPVRRWAEDGADFSISRDDPTCFDNSIESEMELAHTNIGLTIHQLWQAQLNAAKASFAEEPLKSEVIAKVKATEPAKNVFVLAHFHSMGTTKSLHVVGN